MIYLIDGILKKPVLSVVIINLFIFIFIPLFTSKKNISGMKMLQTIPVDIIDIERKENLDFIRKNENFKDVSEIIPQTAKRISNNENQNTEKNIENDFQFNLDLKFDNNYYEISEKIPVQTLQENLEIPKTEMPATNIRASENKPDNTGEPVKKSDKNQVYKTSVSGDLIKSEYSENEVEQKPEVLKKVEPAYPFIARELNKEGKVKLNFLANKNGNVEKIEIVNENPANIFSASAINALKKWKFIPGKIKGKPVDVKMTVEIKFELEK
ncbi:MAG TPA: energy transducer TonB [bacterium]|nr:energy transducer TonB [bacterium]HPN32633.1 energy transducer TonB [bacterium]